MINKDYSRRNFLKQNTLAGLGLIGSTALQVPFCRLMLRRHNLRI
jgi:hypothetical protein